MTHEPDRPRRDVSIEEAERMPMSEEELEAWETYAQDVTTAYDRESAKGLSALVAEVRRLRDVERRFNVFREWNLRGKRA